MIKEVFLSDNNKQLLYSIIKDHIKHEKQVNDQIIEKINIKNRLGGLMDSYYQNNQITYNSNIPIEKQITQINKNILKISLNGFGNLVDQYQRDVNNYIPKKTQSIEQIKNTRSDEIVDNNDMVKNMIEFEEKNKQHSENEINFENRLKLLQRKREQTFKDSLSSKPNQTKILNNQTEIYKNLKIDDSSIKEANFYPHDNSSNTHSLNMENTIDNLTTGMYQQPIKYNQSKLNSNKSLNTPPNQVTQPQNQVTQPQNQVTQPHPFVSKLPIPQLPNPNDIYLKQFDQVTLGIPPPPDTISISPPPDSITSKLVIINASDRKWYGKWITDDLGNDILIDSDHQNRYNFGIKFSDYGDTSNFANINRNFKNIISIEIADVILSTHDNPILIGFSYQKESKNEDFFSDKITRDIGNETSEGGEAEAGEFEGPEVEEGGGEKDEEGRREQRQEKNKEEESVESNIADDIDKDIDKDINDDKDGDGGSDSDSDSGSDSGSNSENSQDKMNKEMLMMKMQEKQCENNNKYIYYNIYTYPFLLIKIKEYEGNIITSNNTDSFTARLVIGKNYINNSLCKNNDIVQGYILMKPLANNGNSSVIFRPKPLINMDKLTISLIKPNGELYGAENKWNLDNIKIIGLGINKETMDFYVDPPFHPSMYLCGDSISIKCFEFLILNSSLTKIKKTLTDSEESILNTINIKQTFYIKKTSYTDYGKLNFINLENKTCLPEFHNIISINIPLAINNQCCYEPLISCSGKWSAGGFIINKNIQPIYTLNVTYLENNIK